MNISKLITFIFRNRTIFWDILKWNRGQTKWNGGSILIKKLGFLNRTNNLRWGAVIEPGLGVRGAILLLAVGGSFGI